MISKFLSSRGFAESPFASTNADKEPLLAQYFVPPPYFTSVKGDPKNPKSNVIFAPRGAGKTAQKVMLEEYAEAEKNIPFFCITYDSFRHLPRTRVSSVNVEWHLSQIVQRLVSGILVLIQDNKFKDLDRSEKLFLTYCFKRYLGSLSEAEASDILKSIKNDLERFSDFVSSNGRNIVKIIAAVPTLWGLSPLDLEVSEKLLRDEPSNYVIRRLIEIIRSYGYESIYVLVDRVDEISEFSNDARACGQFVAPLITELNLLEMDHLAFKFFLWDQVEDYLAGAGMRSDRILIHKLNWSAENLSDMLTRRLQVYSQGKVSSLNDLVDAQRTLDVHRLICCLGDGSPRDVIRLVGRIIDEHTKSDDTEQPLTWRSIQAGIKNYARERSIELYGVDKINDLSKIGSVSFTIGEIANDIFRFSHQAGRNKIQNMMNVGAVVKSGEIENPGNRPLHQYSVVDPRLACVVLSSYKLEDILKDFLFSCPRCNTILAREGEDAVCHECSLEFQLADESSLFTLCG